MGEGRERERGGRRGLGAEAGSGGGARDRPASLTCAVSVSVGRGIGRAGRRAAADAPAAMQEQTPLHFAARSNHLEAVKALVDLNATVDARDVSVAKGRGR